MKKTMRCILLSCALPVWGLMASTAAAKDFVLTDTEKGIKLGDWSITSAQLKAQVKTPFSVSNKVLHGGKQEGSEVITISSGDFVIKLSPSRGMGILSVTGKGLRLGWDSPVDEVVNPAFVNLESRGGSGWLDGFNEMMVRCGFEWTGHAVVADGMTYTLHGRAGNTPASKVIVGIEERAPYAISVKGLIKENTFKKSKLETWAELRYVPGSATFTVHDAVTNKGDYRQDFQIIYHSNFGAPLLEEGAKFHAPIKEISPFNDYAVQGIDDWQTYLGPTRDFDEMVFNVIPFADENKQTLALLTNKAGDRGVSIGFDITQLPVLSLWKNTDTLKQGYVTGLEPGTSFAYPVTIAREQGRVRTLEPGQSANFDLEYRLLPDRAAVDGSLKRIAAIQEQGPLQVNKTPMTRK
ncbi:MAG: aldose 1-epimerase family protein [Candidatus Accumulibacter sp.]|jgi:hypothetical protein|nr:aldose 1-epimerase family protein [Accumulibacter sp.]